MTIQDSFRPGIPDQISPEEFHRLLMAGRIVDGRCGGVLVAKPADQDGPRGIFKVGSDYLIQGRFSGGDFVMNAEAAIRNLSRLKAMNAGVTLRERVQEEPEDAIHSLIVTTAYPHDRLLWLEFAQFVVTGEAASKHVVELSRMNAEANPHFYCDLYQVFGCDPGTADGVV